MTDNFYHESGHAVIAKIFENFFETKFVTLDKSYSKQFDPRSEGGLFGKPKKRNIDINVEDHDVFIFIFIAGYCADGIMNNNGRIPETFFEMKNWGPQFALEKYSGDAYLISLHFSGIKNHLQNIEWENYISKTMKCTCKVLQDYIVWESVKLVRNALFSSPNQTLTVDELKLIFEKNDLQKHIEERLPTLLALRKKYLK